MKAPRAASWLALLAEIAICNCRGQSGEDSVTGGAERARPKPGSSTEGLTQRPDVAPGASGATREGAPRGGDAAGKPEPVGGPWVTCYAHFRPTSTPERDVTRLALLCGPENGMKIVGSTITADASDIPIEHPLEAKPGECFRVFAVAAPQVTDLAIEVRDPKGVPVASDHNNDRWPILNPDGPFCLLDGGKHTVRVHARQGRGSYALQIWRLP